MYYCKLYTSLPKEAVFIRTTVFMEEQGFAEEFDAADETARHLVLYEDEKPAAVCRFFRDEEKQCYTVGRVAVLKEFRGRSLGSAVLHEAEEQVKRLNGKSVCLAAQVQARGFYEKQGYSARGPEFMEEFCPHVWMYKNLEAA